MKLHKVGTTLILARDVFPRDPLTKRVEHARQIACAVLAKKLFAPGVAKTPEARIKELLDGALTEIGQLRPLARWPAGRAVRIDLVDVTAGRFTWYRVTTTGCEPNQAPAGEFWLRPDDLAGASLVEGTVM